jgi:hypothetical protein
MADLTQHPVACTLNEPDLARRRQEARPPLETEQSAGA